MKVLYITKGQKLKKKQFQLVVCSELLEHVIDLTTINCIVIEQTQCSITCDVFIMCSENHVPLVICNKNGRPQIFCHDLYEYHCITSRLQDQIQWSESKVFFEVHKQIIRFKLIHQLELMKTHFPLSRQNLYFENKISELLEVSEYNKVDGIEAYCAKKYFKILFGSDFTRDSDCLINSSLNYGYAILRSIIISVIVSKGLHPSLGIWHKSQFNNYNLADDLIEIYRPIVDYLVFSIFQSYIEFNKECKILLQQTIFQEVLVNDKICDFRYSVELFVDSIIKTFESDSIEYLTIPNLCVDLYEY